MLSVATLAALNIPAEQRVGQIRANLERWRWASGQLPPDRLEVNIAGAWLDVYQGGKVTLSMRAIVGRPADPTPSLQAQVEALVFAPPWNVPAKIAAKQVWPKERRHPGYLARDHFIVKANGGLQQLPGPKSALGRVKFDIPNPFGVYLHDTPNHKPFAGDRRTLSHGCMRLDQPGALAKLLLKDDRAWPERRIDAAMDTVATVRVPLARPVPVYVFYWTALVDEQGRVNFRPDVYGWDARLLSMLSPSGVTGPNLTMAAAVSCLGR